MLGTEAQISVPIDFCVVVYIIFLMKEVVTEVVLRALLSVLLKSTCSTRLTKGSFGSGFAQNRLLYCPCHGTQFFHGCSVTLL